MPSVRWCCTCRRRKTPTPRDDSLRSCAERCRDREVTRRPGARALSLAIVIAMVAGCDMPVAPPAPAGPQQPAEVTTCNGTPAPTRTDWQYPASVDAVFTGSERRALSRLHAEGWNGEGVAIVVRDEFNADGSPSHGEAVLDVARHYAPNALFIRSSKTAEGARQPPDEYFQRHNPVQVSNNSFGGSPGPGTVDALPVEQSGTTSEGVLEVWAAGNVKRPMGRSPADAVPAIEHNVFVHVLALAFDFTELMHTETPCTGSGCRNGLLHAKSGVLVVGAVDYRSNLDDWTLSHANGSHSARAGHARNAFLVTPDDNREETFAGTSFAAPRVSAALAILKQKCPDLSYRRLSFILLKSARDLGEQGVDEVYGFGLLDLERAFEQAESLAAMFESYDSTIPATTP